MIKASGVTDGLPLMLLGLTGENIARLVAGEPIQLNMAEVGLPPCVVVIHYGTTDQDIIDEMAKLGAIPPQQVPNGDHP